MKSHLFGASIFIGLVVWFTSACVPVTPAPRAESPEAIYTAAAQTMAAELTLAAGNTAVARLTEFASSPTATISLPTLPPLPTHTPTAPPSTPLPPSATPETIPCDTASFVGDVTVGANAVFSPGERFVKTWRIENTGSCSWTPDYTLAFSGGDALGGLLLTSLPKTVGPGETVDISLEMSAPFTPGNYQGYWMFRDPSDALIEIAPLPLGALWVQIQVLPSSTITGELDFAADYCTAQWRSNVEYLGCPGISESRSGSMDLLDEPRLESRNENETALWLRPGEGRNGWISGEYPAYTVLDGDHFISEIGCLKNNPQCELLFELDYRDDRGNIKNLDSWQESYDGDTTEIDLDLNDLVGETVNFILRVTNKGKFKDANAFWLRPRIENQTSRNDFVMSWRQEGGADRRCFEVKVYLTGRHSAEARARSCGSSIRESGTARLSNAEVNQLLDWIDRFSSFEVESETPTSGKPLTEQITFVGEGDRQTRNADIIDMQDFMLSLYNSIIF